MNLYQHLKKMKMIPKKITDEVLFNVMQNETNIMAVLESLGCEPKKKPNGWIEARCPDHVLHAGHASSHNDKFNLSPSGLTNCFTGHHTSNIIKVLSNAWKMPVAKTIETLYNSEIPVVEISHAEQLKKEKEVKVEKLEIYKKQIDWLDRSVGKMPLSDEALAFFCKDGISEFTLCNLGVFAVKENGFNDYLYHYAIIPFLNEFEHFIGYAAVCCNKEKWIDRAFEKRHKIDHEVTTFDVRQKFRKVIFCPGFNSGEHLYGLFEVLNGNKDKSIDELMIVEGERDCIKMIQEGIPCISIHGSILKDKQLELLTRCFSRSTKIHIGLDMDEAGRNGANKMLETLKPYYDRVDILDFPDGKDPKKFSGDEIIKILKN